MLSTATLTATLILYGLGTLTVLFSLVKGNIRPQRFAMALMILGFVTHTIWIGTICARTGHPPLTNLPEAAGFLAWLTLAVEIALALRYKIFAASFFVYPLVLLLMIVSAVVGESFQPRTGMTSLFVAHLLLTTIGLAALLLALAFFTLYRVQERALRKKTHGPFYDWIPSLQVCDLLSFRALSIGFAIYTTGIIAGFLWSYKTTAGLLSMNAKELGAISAWLLFGILLQSYISGTFRTPKTMVISAAAFASIVVAIFGIQHV
jgi:ABC-type uncharacterized transport system permease subunit